MTELHQTLHNDYGICLWTLLAACAFAALLIILIVHVIRQGSRRVRNNKKIKDYNRDMEAMGVAAVSEADNYRKSVEAENSEPVILDVSEPVEQETGTVKLFDGKQ